MQSVSLSFKIISFKHFIDYTSYIAVTCEDIGYVSLKSSNKCMKWYNSSLTWIDANTTCHLNGGNLFRISTHDMLQEVHNITTLIGNLYNIRITSLKHNPNSFTFCFTKICTYICICNGEKK